MNLFNEWIIILQIIIFFVVFISRGFRDLGINQLVLSDRYKEIKSNVFSLIFQDRLSAFDDI